MRRDVDLVCLANQCERFNTTKCIGHKEGLVRQLIYPNKKVRMLIKRVPVSVNKGCLNSEQEKKQNQKRTKNKREPKIFKGSSVSCNDLTFL